MKWSLCHFTQVSLCFLFRIIAIRLVSIWWDVFTKERNILFFFCRASLLQAFSFKQLLGWVTVFYWLFTVMLHEPQPFHNEYILSANNKQIKSSREMWLPLARAFLQNYFLFHSLAPQNYHMCFLEHSLARRMCTGRVWIFFSTLRVNHAEFFPTHEQTKNTFSISLINTNRFYRCFFFCFLFICLPLWI